MDFFNKTGTLAMGSRLRMLADTITEDAAAIYKLYGADIKAKWFPVFFTLSDGEPRTITALAKEIGHSHPSVSNIIREMSSYGLVKEKKDKTDGRRNMVQLSSKGKEIAKKMPDQYADVRAAIDTILQQTQNNLWKAIEEWEFLLSERSLMKRVGDERKIRESRNVKIVPYKAQYSQVFKALNEDWITTHFEMEEADYKTLDNPDEYILGNGGLIFIALYKDEPVGTCALLKMNDGNYELAKMAVNSKLRGFNIGYLLGKTAVDKAQEIGARKIYLESNTLLKPAIQLYLKLGFKKIAGHNTPYKRCNIQMELIIKE